MSISFLGNQDKTRTTFQWQKHKKNTNSQRVREQSEPPALIKLINLFEVLKTTIQQWMFSQSSCVSYYVMSKIDLTFLAVVILEPARTRSFRFSNLSKICTYTHNHNKTGNTSSSLRPRRLMGKCVEYACSNQFSRLAPSLAQSNF